MEQSLLESGTETKTSQHEGRLNTTNLRKDIDHREVFALVDLCLAGSSHCEGHHFILLSFDSRNVLFDLLDLVEPEARRWFQHVQEQIVVIQCGSAVRDIDIIIPLKRKYTALSKPRIEISPI